MGGSNSSGDVCNMEPVKSLNHIGIAVESIESQRDYYEQVLGARFEGFEEIASQQLRVGFFRVGDIRVELMERLNSEGPIAKFLQQRGPGLHHVAYTVDDIQARIDELKASGITMIDETPRPGAHGTKIAFMHPKSTFGVLTEICEPQAANDNQSTE